MDVFNEAGEIIYTSRLVYAYPFVSAVIDLPFQILPIDTTEYFNPLEAETEITEENLGDTVRLYTDIQVS